MFMVSSGPGGRRWVALGVIYLCSLAFAVSLQSVPPLVSLLVSDLRISYAEAGLLMSLFALPGVALAIPMGMLADRYGQRGIIIVSFIVLLIGQAAFALGHSFPVLGIGRVVSGAGAVSLFILLPQMVAKWFTNRELGVAMGILNTGMPLGTILSLNLLSLAGELLGWRSAAWLSMGIPALAFIVVLLLFQLPPEQARPVLVQRESPFRGIRTVGHPMWVLGISWLMFNAALISLFTFTPGFLTASGLNVSRAGLIASSVMWPSLLVSPAVGLLIDRVGHQKAMIMGGGFALAVLIALAPVGLGWIFAIMLLIGVAQTFVPSPTMALAPEIMPPEKLGLGYGVIGTCLNLGVIVGPAVVGWVRDATGSFTAGYATMAAFALLIALVLIGLRVRPKVRPGVLSG